jgi:hypothetical protein
MAPIRNPVGTNGRYRDDRQIQGRPADTGTNGRYRDERQVHIDEEERCLKVL